MENRNGKLWVRIEETMRLRGMDIPTLASKSGLTRQTIYNVKKSGTGHLETVKKIAEALDVGASYLLA